MKTSERATKKTACKRPGPGLGQRPPGRLRPVAAVLFGSLLGATAAFAAQQGKPGAEEAGKTGSEQAGSALAQGLPAPYRLSSWLGKPVQNADGESLGKVEEIVMDDAGIVRYVIVQRPDSAGGDAQRVAVPLGHFNYRVGKSPELTIGVSAAHMQAAPAFAADSWPNLGEPQWDTLVVSYWVSPTAGQAGGSQNFEANRDMVYLSEEKEALFSRLDEDDDAAIEWEEAKQHERLAREFDRIDSYSNDRITRSEFAAFEVRPAGD